MLCHFDKGIIPPPRHLQPAQTTQAAQGSARPCPSCTCSFSPRDLEEALPEQVSGRVGYELWSLHVPRLSHGALEGGRIVGRLLSSEVDPSGLLGTWQAVQCGPPDRALG